jgi:hypothetical protein
LALKGNYIESKNIRVVGTFFFCSASIAVSTTGEPGIEMGDSYERVLEILKKITGSRKLLKAGEFVPKGIRKQ